VPALVNGLTGGHGADITFDATYVPSSFVQSAKSTKEGGHVVFLGNVPAATEECSKIAASRKIHFSNADLVPYAGFNPNPALVKERIAGGLAAGAKLIQDGKMKPHISKVVKLEGIQDELDLNMKGSGRPGKVVVQII